MKNLDLKFYNLFSKEEIKEIIKKSEAVENDLILINNSRYIIEIYLTNDNNINIAILRDEESNFEGSISKKRLFDILNKYEKEPLG